MQNAFVNKARNILKDRDDFMANAMRTLYSCDVKIVHVGGMMHNCDDTQNQTLYSRIRDPNPTRATLYSYRE